ncbi:MAG: PAS domain S-box protein [Deltaproteobacteria bacterium]|nr:PAS domain S-box protein [Deltaproteobacteria bacterium]
MTDAKNNLHRLAREKFLGLSLESTRKSYYPQLQKNLETTKENERRLQLLIDNLPALISYVDLEERYVFVNRAHEKVFGLPCERLVGRRMETILGPDNYPRIKPHIREALGGQPRHFEFSYVGQHGEVQWQEVNYVPDLDPQGGVAGFYVLAIDLTEKKRAEQEREKLQAQLLQAQKMESVGRLAGGVAHDFNNMLSVILGHAELALMTLRPDQSPYNDLKEIHQAAKRSADLTRHLLAFARKQLIRPQVIDLNATVAGMLQMLRRLIGEDIDLVWAPETGLSSVLMDPSQVDQMLVNLCVNARDAIAGVGRVTIETKNLTFDEVHVADHPEAVPGDYVLLAVSDDGCGMDPETLKKLFEPFFTTKETGQGTGLGLATVYGIVKQNQGVIQVYSEPGRGAIFKIYLPRYTIPVEPLPPENAASPMARGQETILLVEDELTLLEVGKTMLERLGYRVLAVPTPGEALRAAGEYDDAIHLLLTDVIMPEMNGWDLAKNLTDLYPGLRCLFMSGYTGNVIAHRGILDEGVYFIQKPFSVKNLAAKVREALASRCP